MTDEFNFDHSVDQAWRRFGIRLSGVLSMMDETEPLLLQPCDPGDTQWYIRFTQEAKGWVEAYVPLILDGQPLSDEQVATLDDLGWKKNEKGFLLKYSQDLTVELADAANEVLRKVFHLEHPVFIHPSVLEEVLTEPAVEEEPNLPAREETAAFAYLSFIELTVGVREELTRIFGTPPMRDQDGDYAVRVGSTMIFVRITPDSQEIRLFSMIVHDIAGRSRAAEVLNDVNAHTRWVRFSLVRDKIIAALSLYATPFVPAHLRQAITEIATVADGVDDLLADSLHGKTTFPDEVS
ncbi:MAG: YbjN domain-containing protein [Propionibacteriaceae bacterium]|jgi:hypothetical protein|nr:YbjN domain-containing protein [Propionibacteriaceae bacterium]